MTALARSVTTFDEPPGCIDTPSRLSPASIVRFWWDDDDQLGVLAELGDEPEEAVQVDVVERGLDLVHHVERRRPAAEHGEQERQRGQAALATGQQRQLLDVLAARLGLDLDARVEQVVGRREHELAGAAGEQRGEQLREVAADVGERGREHVLDLLVDGLDHAGQVAAGGAHVLELLLEERVALLELVELLERERVDRAEQAQLAIELADAAGGGRALRELGLLGGLGDGGFDVEVATQRLDRVLEPQLGLGLLDLGAMRAVPRLVERPLRLVPRLAGGVEPGRSAPAPRRSGGGAARSSVSCSTSITPRWAATS